MARRWRGRRSGPTRAKDACPERRTTSATSRLLRRRHAQRAALRVAMVACPAARVGGVSCVSRAVVRGRWWPRRAWMTRSDTPRARRWVAEACRSVGMEAALGLRLWRTPRVPVL